jgi:hypothetical protein
MGLAVYIFTKLRDHTTFNLNYLSSVIVVMDGTVINHDYTPFHGKWIQIGVDEDQWVNSIIYNMKNKTYKMFAKKINKTLM